MTKLTLEHNGRKYKWIGDKWGDFTVLACYFYDSPYVEVNIEWIDGNPLSTCTFHTPEQLVNLGYLKEVKENKEPPILEKLREELEDRASHWNNVPIKRNCYKDALALLTSLETKEEKYNPVIATTHSKQETQEVLDSFKDWQPTPGELIEVSNDNCHWQKREFVTMELKFNRYITKPIPEIFEDCFWKYARPLTEEVIVPELPEIQPHNSKDLVEFRESEFTAYISLHEKVNELVVGYEAITQWIHSQSKK